MADLLFYLPSTGAAAVSPAYSATWNGVAPSDRIAAVTTKINSAITSLATTNWGTTGTYQYLGLRQYVSAAQSARGWTTADTIKAQVMFLNDNVTTCYLAMVIRVVSNDGGTFRGILYSGYGPTAASASYPGQNRSLGAGGASVAVQNAVTQQANDRIVIEVGGYAIQATPWNDFIAWFGDPTASSSLLENETSVDETLCSWVSFTYGSAAPTNVIRMII